MSIETETGTMDAKQYQKIMTELQSPFNPYQDETDKIRLSADVATEHRRQIGSVIPDRGILSDSITAFIYSIVHDIEKHNLTHYSTDNEKHLRSLIARRTSLTIDSQTDGRNVTRSTKSTPTRATGGKRQRPAVKKTGRRKSQVKS